MPPFSPVALYTMLSPVHTVSLGIALTFIDGVTDGETVIVTLSLAVAGDAHSKLLASIPTTISPLAGTYVNVLEEAPVTVPFTNQ